MRIVILVVCGLLSIGILMAAIQQEIDKLRKAREKLAKEKAELEKLKEDKTFKITIQ